MIEVQNLIDNLRSYLQREFLGQSEELKSVIAQYAAACQEANLRLRTCEDLVKRGLPTEAVFLASAEPDLMDTVTLLDFPEKQDLVEICGMYSLPLPEPLLMEVAAALPEAYAAVETIKPLLAEQQNLVLGRRPLRERILVLRQLRDAEPASPFWTDDLRNVEASRIRELTEEARKASARGDMGTLQSLLTEAQSGQWLESVPAEVVREIRQKGRATQSQQGIVRMRELAEDLHAAFMSQDAARARTLREEWQAKQRIVKAAEDDPLIESVSPVLQWLEDLDHVEAEERGFQKAVLQAEQLLFNDGTSIEDLQKAGADLVRFQRSLPPGLDVRFNQRMEQLELSQTRRRRAVYVGAGIGTLAIAALFGVIVYWSIQADQARKIAQAVRQHVESGQLAQARELLNGHPEYVSSNEWLEARKGLIDAEQAEVERVSRWQQAMTDAKTRLEEGASKMTLDALAPVEEPVRQAKELARTDREKTDALIVEGEWQQKTGEVRRALEEAYRETLNSVSAQVQAVDRTKNLNTGVARQMIAEAEQAVGRLQASQAGIPRELTGQVELLRTRLINARARALEQETEERLLDEITKAAYLSPKAVFTEADGQRFPEALKEYGKVLPESLRTPKFLAAAENSPLPGTLARHQLSVRWRGKLLPATYDDVATRIEEIKSYLEKYPTSPDRELLGRYIQWLNSILLQHADNGDEDEGVIQQATRLFSSKLMSETYTLSSEEGDQVYYLNGPRNSPFGSLATFDYLVGFNGESVKFSGPPTHLSGYRTVPAAHEEYCKESKRIFKSVTLANWGTAFDEQIQRLLAETKIDPFLRYLILYKLIDFAGRGDSLLEDELRPLKRRLDDAGIDRTIAWMDPTNFRANKARELAAQALKSFPPVKPVFEKCTARHADFERQVFAEPFSVGWLERTADSQWQCRTEWIPDGDYDLFIPSAGSDPNASRWNKVGATTRGEIQIESALAAPYGEPSVIYALARKRGNPAAGSP